MAGHQLIGGVAIPLFAPASCEGEFFLGLEQGKFTNFGQILRQSGVDRERRQSSNAKHLEHLFGA
jgi:hypothetical protein